MEMYKADVIKKPVRIHNELTVKMKLDLIEDAENHPTMTQKDLAKKYGIGKSTVGDILRRQKGRLLELKAQTAANSGSNVLNDDSMGFSYEQICRSLISAEKINNNLLNAESLDTNLDNNNTEYEYDLHAQDDDDEDMDYCPPVKTVLEETQDEEIKLMSKEEKRDNVSKKEKLSEPTIKRRRNNLDNNKTLPLLQPILFAGFDLKHLLSPTQLNRCYTALGFPRPASAAGSHNESLEGCESDDILEHKESFQESDDNNSELSTHSIDSDEEQSDMSLLDAYELTQHLCNCMKKLLPECVPYIMKCKSLMEKKLGLPATGQQTKILDYFSPSKSSSS